MFTLPLVYFPTSLINCPSWSFHLQIWEMVNVAHVVLFLNSHCYHWVHVGASSTGVLPADFSTHPRLSHPRWDTESVLSHFSALPPAAGGQFLFSFDNIYPKNCLPFHLLVGLLRLYTYVPVPWFMCSTAHLWKSEDRWRRCLFPTASVWVSSGGSAWGYALWPPESAHSPWSMNSISQLEKHFML